MNNNSEKKFFHDRKNKKWEGSNSDSELSKSVECWYFYSKDEHVINVKVTISRKAQYFWIPHTPASLLKSAVVNVFL